MRDVIAVPAGVGERLVAVGDGGERTYADLRHAAARLQRHLEARASAAPPLLLCADRFHFCVGLLGCWLAGTSAALPPGRNPDAVARLAQQLGPVLQDEPEPVTPDAIDVRQFDTTDAPICDEAFVLPGDYPIVTVYSSGTTGQAQAYPKTTWQLLGEVEEQARLFEVSAEDRFLCTVPSQHIYGLAFGALLPLLAGASFVRETPNAAVAIAGAVRARAASVLVSVPPQWTALCHHGARLSTLRLGLSSGARLDSNVGRELARLNGVQVSELLGSSETGGIAIRRCDRDEHYRPLPWVRVHSSPQGRLVMRSPFIDDPTRDYESADEIELLPDGGFIHLGRSDGVVKVGAKRVTLQEIERHAREHPKIADAAALRVEVDGLRGSEVWLAVALKAEAKQTAESYPAPPLTSAELRRWLTQRLDRVLVPRRIRVLDALPREGAGKLPRARLEQLFVEDPSTDGDDVSTSSTEAP